MKLAHAALSLSIMTFACKKAPEKMLAQSSLSSLTFKAFKPSNGQVWKSMNLVFKKADDKAVISSSDVSAEAFGETYSVQVKPGTYNILLVFKAADDKTIFKNCNDDEAHSVKGVRYIAKIKICPMGSEIPAGETEVIKEEEEKPTEVIIAPEEEKPGQGPIVLPPPTKEPGSEKPADSLLKTLNGRYEGCVNLGGNSEHTAFFINETSSSIRMLVTNHRGKDCTGEELETDENIIIIGAISKLSPAVEGRFSIEIPDQNFANKDYDALKFDLSLVASDLRLNAIIGIVSGSSESRFSRDILLKMTP